MPTLHEVILVLFADFTKEVLIHGGFSTEAEAKQYKREHYPEATYTLWKVEPEVDF